MRNRYGDEYEFAKVGDNTYTIKGDLKYWRYGGLEGQDTIDWSNLGFADPSGGPFIGLGYQIENQKVTRIYVVEDTIYFEVGNEAK